MTDAGFVLAAYAVVLGVLGGYVVTLGRRTRSARRLLGTIERQRATLQGDQRANANAGVSDAEARGPER